MTTIMALLYGGAMIHFNSPFIIHGLGMDAYLTPNPEYITTMDIPGDIKNPDAPLSQYACNSEIQSNALSLERDNWFQGGGSHKLPGWSRERMEFHCGVAYHYIISPSNQAYKFSCVEWGMKIVVTPMVMGESTIHAKKVKIVNDTESILGGYFDNIDEEEYLDNFCGTNIDTLKSLGMDINFIKETSSTHNPEFDGIEFDDITSAGECYTLFSIEEDGQEYILLNSSTPSYNDLVDINPYDVKLYRVVGEGDVSHVTYDDAGYNSIIIE